jgi:2-dehydro-3-deoxyphosphogluconate aldolase / (4S)-4-hydroxy-2-oxoglutarate aldolase
MDILAHLRAARLLSIVRADDSDQALRCLEVIAEEGIDLIEISLTGRGALSLIRRARAALGDAVAIGAGTVLTARQADDALAAGASYVVTPSLSAGADHAVGLGVPALVGALTPSEVNAAMERGATAVKLFPASHVGPGYLADLRQPFPDVPFVPVGGVDAAAARAFLAAGAVAVGVGSPLQGDAAGGGSLDALRARARTLREAVAP